MLIYLEIKKCQNNPQMKEITTKTFKYFKLKDNGNTTHNLIQQKRWSRGSNKWFERQGSREQPIGKEKRI